MRAAFARSCDETNLIHKQTVGEVLAIQFEGDALANSAIALLERNRDRILEMLPDEIAGQLIILEEDPDAETEDIDVTDLEFHYSGVIEASASEVFIESEVTLALEFGADVADYDNSPFDEGDYVFVYKNYRRYEYELHGYLTFTVRVDDVDGLRIPIEITTVILSEPTPIRVPTGARYKTIRRWSDDHGI